METILRSPQTKQKLQQVGVLIKQRNRTWSPPSPRFSAKFYPVVSPILV